MTMGEMLLVICVLCCIRVQITELIDKVIKRPYGRLMCLEHGNKSDRIMFDHSQLTCEIYLLTVHTKHTRMVRNEDPCSTASLATNATVLMRCVKCTELPVQAPHRQLCQTIDAHVVCVFIKRNLSCVFTTFRVSNRTPDDNLDKFWSDERAGRQLNIVSINRASVCKSLRKPTISEKCSERMNEACDMGDIGALTSIISQGHESFNCILDNSKTPIMKAALDGHEDIFHLLLHLGSLLWVEYGNRSKNKLFILACKGGRLNIVRCLIELGADVDRKNNAGNNALHVSIYLNDIDLFNYLVGISCNISATANNGVNILHKASKVGNVKLIDRIVKMKIIGMESRDHRGWTPICFAVANGKLKAVKYFYENRCNVSVVSNKKRNLMHIAARKGRLNMVKYIVSLNVVRLDAKDVRHNTPLMLARMRDETETVDYLVKVMSERNLTNT